MLIEILEAVKMGNFEWRKHILIRLAERKITQDTVLEVILGGEIIVVSFDPESKKAYIITVYNPTLDKFESDFKTRRR